MTKLKHKPAVQRVAEQLRERLDNPLRSSIVRPGAVKVDIDTNRVGRVMSAMEDGDYAGVDIERYGPDNNPNGGIQYRIVTVDRIPTDPLFIDARICAELRAEVKGTAKTVDQLMGDYNFARGPIERHLRGDCKHDVGHPPVGITGRNKNATNRQWSTI